MGAVRGIRREIETPYISAKAKFSIHNRFDVERIDIRTGEIKQRAYGENIILDALWTRLLAPGAYFGAIHFGTGNGDLSPTKNSLFSFLAAKSTGNAEYNSNLAEGWMSCRKQIKIESNEYLEKEITEVGIGYNTSTNNLMTHAKLRDMNGTYVSIPKTDVDEITIYATTFVYWNVNGYDNIFVYPFNFNRFLTYLLGGSPCNITNLSLWIENCTVNQGGVQYHEGSGQTINIMPIYNAASKKIYIENTRINSDIGNFPTGIKSISVDVVQDTFAKVPIAQFNVPGNWFLKTAITNELVGIGDDNIKDFKTNFYYVKPGIKLYIDNNEIVSGFTVDLGRILNAASMGLYFILIDTDYINESFYSLLPTPELIMSRRSDSYTKSYYAVYYNPNWILGIDSFKYSRISVEVSDNMIDWATLVNTTNDSLLTYNVETENKNKKYWRLKPRGSYGYVRCYNFTTSGISDKNIHFDTAPAAGVVITADYDCEVIAKDEEHVFDFSFEISLGEKTS